MIRYNTVKIVKNESQASTVICLERLTGCVPDRQLIPIYGFPVNFRLRICEGHHNDMNVRNANNWFGEPQTSR